MKKITNLFLILTSLILLASCEPDPIEDELNFYEIATSVIPECSITSGTKEKCLALNNDTLLYAADNNSLGYCTAAEVSRGSPTSWILYISGEMYNKPNELYDASAAKEYLRRLTEQGNCGL